MKDTSVASGKEGETSNFTYNCTVYQYSSYASTFYLVE